MSRRTLPRRKSDPFLAATWNVEAGTPVWRTRRILRKLKRTGVSLFFVQEASNPKVAKAFRDAGYRLHRNKPNLMVAWDPDVWGVQRREDRRPTRLTFRRANGRTVKTEAASVILRHKQSGRILAADSTHMPSRQQARGGYRRGGNSARRRAITRAAITWLADRAKRRLKRGRVDASLKGLDLNIDVTRAARRVWAWVRRRPFTLVLPYSPTHGHKTRGRRIDVFMAARLKRVGGWVRAGGGDHRVHVARFAWV